MKSRYTQGRASRNLSLPAISRLTHEQSFDLIRHIRFADSNGRPYCPRCCNGGRPRWRNDKRWLCNDCRGTFSLFSGTAWQRNRNALPTLLLTLAHFVTNSSGEPCIEIARKADADPTTTYYFLMKIRECLMLYMRDETLSGEVEIDSCYIGGFKRPMNDRALERKLKAMGRWKKPPKKVLCAMRERSTGRVIIEVHTHERKFVESVKKHVAPGSIVYSDMSGSWEPLGAHFDLRSVNHEERYWSSTASTQMVETLFHRLRRLEDNLIHVSSKHLAMYGAEMGFRQTYCRHSDAEKFLFLLSLCLRSPVSRHYAGVWQRRER